MFLFDKNLALSRNKAQEMIKNREVLVDGKTITKTSFEVNDDNIIKIEEKLQYVGRAGVKLKGFLQDTRELKILGKDCLDIGSSTGGFVQVLLEFGAPSVTCVDVGREQLHESLKNNPRVHSFEEMDIRNFKSDKKFPLVTCDVSFIGIENILSDIDRLSSDSIVILFKPQFEVGKDAKRTKNGVVKDSVTIKRVMEHFEATTFKLNWKLLKKEESILKGKEGNAETFYYFTKR